MIKNKIFLIGLCLAPLLALLAIPAIKISHQVVKSNPDQEMSAWQDLEVQEFGELAAIAANPGKKYYVDSAKGNNSYTGTSESQAFKTIQQANQKVAPGDTVYVKNGTYREDITIETSGKPNNWITFQAFPGHKPFVQGPQEAFRIKANYIKIIGFKISSKAENGIAILNEKRADKAIHHIQILKNTIHDCGCNGIGAEGTDYIRAEGNIIYRNAFSTPWQCSGISIYQAINYDNQPGFHNIIRGNISYSNENRRLPENGKEVTDGNGIIIDDFRITQDRLNRPKVKYQSSTLVENNIVFDNGGRGIHVFQSDNVVVRNNTSFHNLKSKNLIGTLDKKLNGEINSSFSNGSTFYNNIAYARDKSKATLLDNYSSGKNKWDYNLAYNGVTWVGKDNSNAILGSNNLINKNPLFINPSVIASKANFRLKPGSPAVNTGTSADAARSDINGRKRPLGAKYDMGAYEMK
jgi:parallel beta-helix repeat protein